MQDSNPDRTLDIFLLILIGAACILVFVTAPKSGYFSWSEAPRNALNGAFIMDLLIERPLSDAKAWAIDYYMQYPALTILFYPPAFHFFLALFFLVFGVSHSTAVACTVSFLFALSCAVYALMRRTTSPTIAAATTLLLLGSPAIFTWGQQVMLEIPMLAFLTWAAYFLIRYQDTQKARDLAWMAVLCVAGAYTKQTALFAGFAFALALLLSQGASLFTRRHFWVVVTLATIALIPLVWMQLNFGAFNITTVVDRSDVQIDRASWHGLSWYLVHLPDATGIITTLLAAAFLLMLPFYQRWRAWRGDIRVYLSWFAVCYAALTAIHLKEVRFGLLMVPPVILAAGLALDALLQGRRRWQYIGFALGLVLFIVMIWSKPTPFVSGYDHAAARMVELLPDNGRVVFSGNRDGSFIFNIRADESRSDITVIRADKLFLNIAIMAEHGLNERHYDQGEIIDQLNNLGIHYVVAVPGTWQDAEVMRNFYKVLESDVFTTVEHIPLAGDTRHREVVIYRNLGQLKQPPDNFGINLPTVDMRIGSNSKE